MIEILQADVDFLGLFYEKCIGWSMVWTLRLYFKKFNRLKFQKKGIFLMFRNFYGQLRFQHPVSYWHIFVIVREETQFPAPLFKRNNAAVKSLHILSGSMTGVNMYFTPNCKSKLVQTVRSLFFANSVSVGYICHPIFKAYCPLSVTRFT